MEVIKVSNFFNFSLESKFCSRLFRTKPAKPNEPAFTHAVMQSYYRSVMVKPSEQGSGFAHPIFEPQVRKRQGLRTFLN